MIHSYQSSYPEDGILMNTHKGTITIHDILLTWEELIGNRKITRSFRGIISDYRNTNFLVQIEDLDILQEFLKKHVNIFRDLKVAVILDSPKIVIPIMFEKNDLNIKTKSFSTLDAAKSWIIE